MLRILSLMLAIITVSTAENRLYNDNCATVLKSNVSSRVARIECYSDSVIFDPKSQNGAFLFNNETGSWTGELFACQCSCGLPNNPQDGLILTNDRVHHGKSLPYKCNYETKNTKKIICLDGILMIVPDFFDDYNNITAFRRKSLPERFFYNFQNAIFQLSVNKMSSWSVHEREVSNIQKYTDILTEKDTVLEYYLLNGKDLKLGTIELNMNQELECSRPDSSATVIIVVCCVSAFIIIIIIIVKCFYKQFWKCLRCPSTSDPINTKHGQMAETGPKNERNDCNELTGEEKKILDNPGNPLLHGPEPSEETPRTVDRWELSIG